MQAFFKKYNYTHEVLSVAADEQHSLAFSFVLDTVNAQAYRHAALVQMPLRKKCMHLNSPASSAAFP